MRLRQDLKSVSKLIAIPLGSLFLFAACSVSPSQLNENDSAPNPPSSTGAASAPTVSPDRIARAMAMAGAGGQFAPTATPRSSSRARFRPNITPRALPTATPSPTPEPLPTLLPTPARAAISNLKPKAPTGWDAPVVISNQKGARSSLEISTDERNYLSWAVVNESSEDITEVFYIDLFFDGAFVERWRNNGIPSGFTGAISDWDKLEFIANPSPGTHRITLVADSTNLIPETDETDNVFETEFVWNESLEASVEPIPVATRLPDLAPATPDDWEAPLVLSSYQGDVVNGPLSVNAPTYVNFAVANDGLSSIPQEVRAHLYLDDVMVKESIWSSGVISGQRVRSIEWDKLYDVTHVSPGNHTLRLVVDPHNLIAESDEENNVLKVDFTWEEGPVPSKASEDVRARLSFPEPLLLPNLIPGWRFGSDGPIVISHEEKTTLDDQLFVDDVPYIDITLQNQSRQSITDKFSVDLYFDDLRVHTFDVPNGLPSGRFLQMQDWEGLQDIAIITEGPHTLRIEIDASDFIWEADEGDNIFEKTFVWSSGSGEVIEAESVEEDEAYTDAELDLLLSDLQDFLDVQEPGLSADGFDYREKILEIAEAGYYLTTEDTLESERVNIFLLTHDDYIEWIDLIFDEKFALADDQDFQIFLEAREKFKRTDGFKTKRFGKVALVIDAEQEVAEVLATLAHELGHLRQESVSSASSELEQLYIVNALQEAQAQQFERAFWTAIEEFTGLELLRYPNHPGFHRYIDSQVGLWEREADEDEHALGFLLQWLAVLDDPQLFHLKVELQDTGYLSAESTLELFEYLIDIPARQIASYVEERRESLSAHLEEIRLISKMRLVDGLSPDDEARSSLTDPGLFVP